jgi:hypothetical protein
MPLNILGISTEPVIIQQKETGNTRLVKQNLISGKLLKIGVI